jgi:hypothetical protein
MDLRKKANLIIYRFRERGLEVFLVNNESSNNWELPQGDRPTAEESREVIELDRVNTAADQEEEGYAVEGDWHEIPSLKSMLYEDAQVLKEKFKDIENGAYVTIKDALQHILPDHQYRFLKELKDILRERNSIRDL